MLSYVLWKSVMVSCIENLFSVQHEQRLAGRVAASSSSPPWLLLLRLLGSFSSPSCLRSFGRCVGRSFGCPHRKSYAMRSLSRQVSVQSRPTTVVAWPDSVLPRCGLVSTVRRMRGVVRSSQTRSFSMAGSSNDSPVGICDLRPAARRPRCPPLSCTRRPLALRLVL